MSNCLPKTSFVPQTAPRMFFEQHRRETLAAMARVLDSGTYILASEVESFEHEFAEAFGFQGVTGVGNGTDALALSLMALGIGDGDRVATVSHTAVATVAAIQMAGGSPVFVDIDPSSYTLDPASLQRTLKAVDGIKAVIVVHLYGRPANMREIQNVARQFDLRVVEDCAQAHGAQYDGKFVGTLGDAAAFSFYPTKNLGGLGDGGAVASTQSGILDRVRMLREYGWKQRYISETAGINSRLDELQAGILRLRLSHLEAGNIRRAEIAAVYNRDLAGTSLILPVPAARAPDANWRHVFHQYVIRHPERENLRQRLKEEGIGTTIHYPVPVHLQPAYAGSFPCDRDGLEVTELVSREVLSLPMFPELSDEDLARTIECVLRLI